MTRHWVTYADGNYLNRLKVLHASMVRHCGDFCMHVLAWDDEVEAWAHVTLGVLCISAELFIARHPSFDRRNLPGPPRTMVEHYWTCGPLWIGDVMEATQGPVTYVDADVMFYGSPEPVFAEIGDAPAAVLPHNFASADRGLPGLHGQR